MRRFQKRVKSIIEIGFDAIRQIHDEQKPNGKNNNTEGDSNQSSSVSPIQMVNGSRNGKTMPQKQKPKNERRKSNIRKS